MITDNLHQFQGWLGSLYYLCIKYKITQDMSADVYKWSLESDSHLSLHFNTIIINRQIAVLAYRCEQLTTIKNNPSHSFNLTFWDEHHLIFSKSLV